MRYYINSYHERLNSSIIWTISGREIPRAGGVAEGWEEPKVEEAIKTEPGIKTRVATLRDRVEKRRVKAEAALVEEESEGSYDIDDKEENLSRPQGDEDVGNGGDAREDNDDEGDEDGEDGVESLTCNPNDKVAAHRLPHRGGRDGGSGAFLTLLTLSHVLNLQRSPAGCRQTVRPG
ncbi:hypothetical protein ACHAPU_007610 [Fusarium lateritium]